MRRIKITVAVGLALLAVTLVLTLSSKPMAVLGTSGKATQDLVSAHQNIRACQSGESLPKGTTAVRLHVYASVGPRVDVTLSEAGRQLAHGEVGSGWEGSAITVPLSSVIRARSTAELCFDVHVNGHETIALIGTLVKGAGASPSGQVSGHVAVEYLRRSHSSWWSRLPEVARRLGLGHAGAGTWSALLLLLLTSSALAAGSWLLVRELQ